MRISVITVCKNAADTIEETILSIINQTHHDIEYIIIDGVSTDGTLEIIEKYKDKISIVISEPDKGIYNAMNKGINLATGDFLNFMNAGDSFVSLDVVEKVVQVLGKKPSAQILYGDYIWLDRETNTGEYYHYRNIYDDFQFFLKTNNNHQSSFYSLDLFKKYGLYSEKLVICSDAKKNMEFLLILGIEAIYCPLSIANYAKGGMSAQNISIYQKEILSLRKKFYGTNYSKGKVYKLLRYFYPNVIKTKNKNLKLNVNLIEPN